MNTLREAYYNNTNHTFFHRKPGTMQWSNVDKGNFDIFLRERGANPEKGSSSQGNGNMNLSEVEEIIARVISTQQIDFALEVAGRPSGVHYMSGHRVLVQHGPNLLTPIKGEFPFTDKFLRKVSRIHPIQYDVLKSWLKLGLTRLYNNRFNYHQVLFMIGDVASGKSLFHHMITVLVGGHACDSEKCLKEHDMFNKDLVEAEHLAMEEPSVHNFRDRQQFANALKKLAATEWKRCRGICADAVQVSPIQLVSISTNMEAKNITVIPAHEAGIEDKFHAVRFPSETMPLEGYEGMDVPTTQDLFAKEAPCFLWHLLNEYQVPDSLLHRVLRGKRDCARMGMDAYHNPEILELLEERSQELTLLAVLSRISGRNGGQPTVGTSAQMCQHMSQMTSDPDAVLLSKNPSNVGCLLRSLHQKYPDRVQKVKKHHGMFVWMCIGDPSQDN